MKEPLPRTSRAEARVTYALKVLTLICVASLMLVAVLMFLARISSVAIILIGTLFFSYLIYPAVVRLQRRGLSLGGAIAVVYVLAAAVVAFGLSYVIPPLVGELRDLAQKMPGFIHEAQLFVQNPSSPGFRFLPPFMRGYLAALPAELGHNIQAYVAIAASSALGILLSTFTVLATLVVIPVLSVYLLFEAEDLKAGIVGLIPVQSRPEALRLMTDLDRVLGGFIRGQVLVGATIGACITIALLIMHVPYALLIGVMAGVLDIIPYIGAVVTFVPAVALADASAGWQHALIVALIFLAVFQAEGHFISPRIVSESVGLSPLMVIIAVLIGGDLLGIPGMFLAVPVAGVLRVLRLHYLPGGIRRRVAPVAAQPRARGSD